jgi:hypothetical protein
MDISLEMALDVSPSWRGSSDRCLSMYDYVRLLAPNSHWQIPSRKCNIWGFHGGDYEEWCLLGCHAVWLLQEPTFRRNLVFLRRVRPLLVTATVVPSSPILVILMMEALRSSKTSVLTRATRRNNPKDTILPPRNIQKFVLKCREVEIKFRHKQVRI